MAKEKMDRRKAMDRMMKMVAVAAGVSVAELETLLASQVQRVQTVKKVQSDKAIVLQKSTSKFVKSLKVMVENSKEVFENEYGRMRPARKVNIQQIRPEINRLLQTSQMLPDQFMEGLADPGIFCGMNFGVSDEILSGLVQGLICGGVNTCTGQDIGGGGCAGTNECNGQDCDIFNCSGNDCDDQNCGEFDICDNNKQSIINVADLNRFRNDPYIQMLFDKFNVTTTTQLAAELRQLFGAQRQRLMKIR